MISKFKGLFSSTPRSATGSSIPLSQVGMTNYGTSPTGSAAGQTNPIMGMTNGMSLLTSFGSLASSGLQMYAANMAGKMQRRRLQMKARFEELEADQILLNASDQINILRDQLLSDITSSQASYAGRGIDIGSGTARQADIESRRRANEDINLTNTQAKREARYKKVGAGQTRADGVSAGLMGKLGAAKAVPKMIESSSTLYTGLKGLLS